MSEQLRTAHIVIDTADGNPSSLTAGVNLDREAGNTVHDYRLRFSGLGADFWHGRMSKDPRKIAKYNHNFAEARLGRAAELGSKAAAAELSFALTRRNAYGYDRTYFHQEHALLGLDPSSYEVCGLGDIELVVPDVIPKVSGVEAVRKHGERALATVWNVEAEEKLRAEGIDTRLVAPYLIEGLVGPNLPRGGDKVVFKASGNGAPFEWAEEILTALREYGYNGQSWSAHLPGRSWSQDRPFGRVSLGKRRRIANFYGSLGGQTDFMVGFPSDLIQVAFAMRAAGSKTSFISLPARGEHEIINRDFAHRYGVLAAQIAFDDGELAGDITTLEPRDLGKFMERYKSKAVDLRVLGSSPLISQTSQSKPRA